MRDLKTYRITFSQADSSGEMHAYWTSERLAYSDEDIGHWAAGRCANRAAREGRQVAYSTWGVLEAAKDVGDAMVVAGLPPADRGGSAGLAQAREHGRLAPGQVGRRDDGGVRQMSYSTIYRIHRAIIADGVQSDAICDATINTAKSIAKQRGRTVVVEDRRMQECYRVTPSGLKWRKPYGWTPVGEMEE